MHPFHLEASLESERRLFYVALTRARKGVFIGASTRPSRFLNEMLLQETQGVMEAIAWLACGEARARQSLLASLRTFSIHSHLLHNLISGYLPDLGQEQLAQQIKSEHTLFIPSIGIPTQPVSAL